MCPALLLARRLKQVEAGVTWRHGVRLVAESAPVTNLETGALLEIGALVETQVLPGWRRQERGDDVQQQGG